jgi:hypothetical protein
MLTVGASQEQGFGFKPVSAACCLGKRLSDWTAQTIRRDLFPILDLSQATEFETPNWNLRFPGSETSEDPGEGEAPA